MTPHARLVGSLMIAFLELGLPACGRAAGPWRGQVVDAETDRPLEGVIVVAAWYRLSPALVHANRDFHDVDEVVTDAEGRFAIPARSLTTTNPFVTIKGPELVMFKPGYGPHHFHREREWLAVDTYLREQKYSNAKRQFETTGAVFELRPLDTRQERVRSLPSVPFLVPESRVPRLAEAIEREHKALDRSP